MSEILLNIFLVAIIIIPMAYFMIGGKSNKAKSVAFKAKMNEIGFNPSNLCVLQSSSLALDKGKKQICLYQPDLQSLPTLNLDDIQSAEVIKSYANETVHEQNLSILKHVHILYKLKDKSEVKWNIYDHATHPQVGMDLMDAMQWTDMLNKAIKSQ